MDLRNELIRAVDALRNANVPYAICGGLAVVIHGYVRLTDDIDLLILPSDILKAKRALQSAGFGFSNPEPLVLPHGQAASLMIHRMLRMEGEDHLILDMIEANDSLQSVWNTKQEYAWEGRSIHVVSLEGLVQMKQRAGRPQDLADIAHLQGGENHRHD